MQINIFNILEANKYNKSDIYWKIKNSKCIGKPVGLEHNFNFNKNEYWVIENIEFTAQDANKMYKKTINTQLNDIIKEIKLVAEKKNNLDYYKKIDINVIHELTKRGFKIYDWSSQCDGTYYKISW